MNWIFKQKIIIWNGDDLAIAKAKNKYRASTFKMKKRWMLIFVLIKNKNVKWKWLVVCQRPIFFALIDFLKSAIKKIGSDWIDFNLND